MIRVEVDADIARPIEEVFDRLTNLSGYERWMSRRGLFLRSAPTSDRPIGPGTTYYDKGRMGTAFGEVVEFAAPARVAFSETIRWLGLPVLQARPAYDLVATPTGTRVHHTAEGTLYGIFKPMRPIVALIARGERRRTVRSLKDSLEQGR